MLLATSLWPIMHTAEQHLLCCWDLYWSFIYYIKFHIKSSYNHLSTSHDFKFAFTATFLHIRSFFCISLSLSLTLLCCYSRYIYSSHFYGLKYHILNLVTLYFTGLQTVNHFLWHFLERIKIKQIYKTFFTWTFILNFLTFLET